MRGTPVRSANQWVIQEPPAVKSVEMLTSDEKLTVGSQARCRATCSPGAHAMFQWYRGTGDGKWAQIASANTSEHVCTVDDIDLYLLCYIEPVNAEGWKGKAVSAVTAEPVSANAPSLVIVVHKNRYQTGMEMTTNLDSSVVWERDTGSETWEFVCEKPVYLLTSNDIGRRIRAASEGLESEPTPVIVFRPQILSLVKALVRVRSFKFFAAAKVGRSSWTVTVDSNGVNLKARTGSAGEKFGKWTTVKCEATTGTRDEMMLWLDRSTKFLMIPTFVGTEQRLEAIMEHTRDFICMTLMEFAKAAGVL
jgi:hypothetical protein